MESMKGKRVVITGPTSGIGKGIARGLGSLGAQLILACRDTAKGEATAIEILKDEGAKGAAVRQVDMSRQQSIRDFARGIAEEFGRIDALVNNAGISRGPQRRAESEDGIELTFATNVVGYFLLTLELMEVLKAGAPSRIVNVASSFASDLDLDDLQFARRPFEGMKAYAQSKVCDRLLTWALARRLEGTRVTANAMAPGLVVDTGLYRDFTAEMTQPLRQRAELTVAQGADTAVWLASSPDVEGASDRFFYQRKEIPCAFRNRESEEKLWEICRELTHRAK